MLLSYFCQLQRLVFDQSTPVHPVSDFRGGGLSVTDGERTDGQTEIHVSYIGLTQIPYKLKYFETVHNNDRFHSVSSHTGRNLHYKTARLNEVNTQTKK